MEVGENERKFPSGEFAPVRGEALGRPPRWAPVLALATGSLRPAATSFSWSKNRPPSACAVVKSAARTITARIGAARARAREAGAKKTAGVSDPVSEDRRFRLSRRAEARARGAASNTSPKMVHTAAVMVDATVDIVARRCARVVVMARVGWFGCGFGGLGRRGVGVGAVRGDANGARGEEVEGGAVDLAPRRVHARVSEPSESTRVGSLARVEVNQHDESKAAEKRLARVDSLYR